MKSLFIVNDFPPILGGQANYYFNLCRAFPREDLIVMAPIVEGWEEFDQLHSLYVLRRSYLSETPILEKLYKVILPFIYSFPIILKKRIKLVHCGHVLSTGIVGLLLRLTTRVPYVVYTHSADILEFQKYPPLKWLLKRILYNAHRVVCNSRFTHDKLIQLGVKDEKIKLIYPKTDVDKFSRSLDTKLIEDRYALHNKKVILSINRLVKRKGNDVMIKAMPLILREVPEAVYLIGGTGIYERQLKGMVEELELSRQIIFLGNLTEDNVVRYYRACDVFVMLSRSLREEDTEGFGVVYLEANACGKPVIGGRSGGIPEAVEDGYSGLLVEPLDVEATAAAVIKLLKDDAYAKRLGEQGRQRVSKDFDRRLFDDEIRDLVKNV